MTLLSNTGTLSTMDVFFCNEARRNILNALSKFFSDLNIERNGDDDLDWEQMSL